MNRLLSPLLALTLSTSMLLGCSKKDESTATPASKAPAIIAGSLLKKLPQSTEFFYAIDASGDGYKQFMQSPWGKTAMGVGSLSQVAEQLKSSGADETTTKALETLYTTVQQLGLISASGEPTFDTVISQAVAYAGLTAQEKTPLELGLYISGAKGVSLKSKLPVLRKALSEADFLVSTQQIAGVDGLVAKIANPDPELRQEVAVYIAASDALMAVSVTQSGAESLFSSADTNTIDTMMQSPQFQKAQAALNFSAQPLVFGYGDIKKLVPELIKIDLETLNDPEEQESLKEMPIDAVAIASGFNGQYTSAISAVVAGRNEAQTKLLTALEGATLPVDLASLPADTAFAFGIDTHFISKLGEFLLAIEEPDGAAAIEQAKDVEGVTFGVRNGDGTSPIPDLYFVVDAKDRANLGTIVEAILGQTLAGATGGTPQWNQKDVDGSPTKFIMTMFGAGVYLSYPKGSDALVVATSERAVKDIIASSTGQKGKLTDSLKASLKDSLSPTKLASMYFNGNNTAALLDSVKSTIAMFAGNSAELDKSFNTAEVRRAGLGTGSISYSNGLFLLETAFDASQVVR